MQFRGQPIRFQVSKAVWRMLLKKHTELKYSKRSLDSDYMWHHSSCSESDDAEDAYREFELHSPASITSYDDADISCLTGENLPENGSVAEENVYPSQNFFTLTWEQDENVFKDVESVESYLDTSVKFLPSHAISDSKLQVTTMCCSKSLPYCRTCQPHMDAGISISFTEDMSWLQTKNVSCTEIHKFDVGHSSNGILSSRDLACESGSCVTLYAKEEKYETSTSLQNDSIARCLPEPYRNLDSVKEEFSVVTVVPPTSKKPLTCITEDHDSIDSTCMFLLEKVIKESSRDVLDCNVELSERNSAVLLDSQCENRHAEVHLMDTKGNVVWDNHNVSCLNAGSHVNENLLFGSPESLAGDLDPIIKNIRNHSSISNETVANDHSGLYVGDLDVNPRCIESKTTSEVCNSDVSLTASQNFVNTVTAICEHIPDTDDCLEIVDFQSPEQSSQMDLIDVLSPKGLPLSFDDGRSSICASNEASPVGNGVDSMAGRLYNLNVGKRGLYNNSAICQESQSSAAIGDPHTSCFQIQAPSDNNFLGLPHIDSICEELGLSQISGKCWESNSKYPPKNRQHSQLIDVIDGTSDSSADHGKESVSCNGIALPATEESTEFNAQLHDDPLSSDPFSRKNNAFAEKDFMSWKLVDEDGKSLSSAFEDIKQIPMTNFCKNEVERQSRAKFLSKDSAIDAKVHHIVVVEGKGCSQPVENQVMNNLWMEGLGTQTAGDEQTLTEGEGKSLVISAGKTCPCCGISDESIEDTQGSIVEPCAGNNMNSCTNDKVQQVIHCKFISEAPREECVTYYGTVLGSVYAEESTVSTLHPLDMNPRESKGSEELSQEDVQKMDVDSSLTASHPVVDLSERQISVSTSDDHLDQADVCALKTGGSEIDLASSRRCLLVGGIHPKMHYDVCSFDSLTTANSDHVFSTDYQEPGCSYVQREESPCLTACVLDRKNRTEKNMKVFNLHQPFMDDDANNVCDSDFASAEILKNVEDDAQRTLVGPDESKREEAAGLEARSGKKILLKSFAGGMTVLGALFLLLQFSRRRETRNVVMNIAKLQREKASQERHPDMDRNNRSYPAENFKF
ncbi:hypothetical protein Taro_044434 [Colocasia esculenta]|uniref:Uncharacterized protein n=1 Tax=Colocasia esculenta TaxID=4460 RepID=A0A843WU21_COLES|nr:hypothetical protein [Colocasia esculenta]